MGQLFAPRAFGSKNAWFGSSLCHDRTYGQPDNRTTTFFFLAQRTSENFRVLLEELGQQYNVGEKPTVILYTYIETHSRSVRVLVL